MTTTTTTPSDPISPELKKIYDILFPENYAGNWQVSDAKRLTYALKLGVGVIGSALDVDLYDTTNDYVTGDTVSEDGVVYTSVSDNPTSTPPSTEWVVVNNSRFGGQAWHIELVYAVGDIVSDKGVIYICVQDTEGGLLSDEAFWMLADKADAFDDTVDYVAGDTVADDGIVYTSVVDNPTTTPPSAEWIVDPIVEFGGKKYADSYNYVVGDIVSEQGIVQVCTTDTIGPFDQANWFELIKPEIGGRGWVADTEYKEDDIVGYDDELYICISSHTSVSGIDPDGNPNQVGQTNWKNARPEATVGITWKDNAEYDIGDIVTYNNNIFIATMNHRSDDSTDSNGNPEKPLQVVWSSKAELGGVLWKVGLQYRIGDSVTRNGFLYFCKRNHTSGLSGFDGGPHESGQLSWEQVRITERGGKEWSATHVYGMGTIVSFSGNIYISKTYTNVGQNPIGNIASWHDISSHLIYKGEFTPIVGTEYPADEDHTYWRVAGLGIGNTYTFTGGDLDTQIVKDGDELIHETVWGIKPGVLIPTEIGGRGYSDNERYLVGDVVTHGGVIYTCITDVINLEQFDASKWQGPQIGILSDPLVANGATEITNIIHVSQVVYDGLTPDPTTLYVVT